MRIKLYLPLLMLFAAMPAFAQQKPLPNPGEPVIIKQDTLFIVHTGQGMFNIKERAEIITQRINTLINRIDFTPDSLIVKNDTTVSIIYYNSQIVMAITDADAAYSEFNRPQLANSYIILLKKKLTNVFENNSFKQIVINILEAIAVVILLIALIWGINRAFRWIKLKVIKAWESRIAKLAEKGAPVAYANRVFPLINNLLRLARLFIILLVIYLALPILFSIFPASKPIASLLLGYIITPLKSIVLSFVNYIPNMLTIAVIFMVTHYIIKLIKFIANEIGQGAFTIKGFYPEWAMPTYNIIRVLLYAFMFVVIFPYLPGSQSDVFKGVTVFLGILFSFGSSSAIANMVSGIVLTYMRPFKIGDRVKIGDITGDVIEKNILVTRLRTIKNEDIIMPNATVLGGHTLNYSSGSDAAGLILNTTITIGYDAPWQQVHQLMIDAALATDGVQQQPKPFVLQTALNDFNVSYQVNAYTTLPNKMAVIYSGLHQNLQDKFNEAGVEIMSPHFSALRDGNGIQIPDDYKPKDYQAPGFKVGNDPKAV